MAMGSVPERYLDAWARLQVQKPVAVSDGEWRQASINGEAVQFGWTPGDLLDYPRDTAMGLASEP
jgi:hypothetical protein